MKNRLSRGQQSSRRVLVEVMVGLVLSTMLVAMTGSLWLYGIRNFGAVANYTELEAKSRNGLDFRSRNLRPASSVTGFQNSGSTEWVRLTNAVAGTQIVYTRKATL
jgi:Tfp pilus assembly protein PilW